MFADESAREQFAASLGFSENFLYHDEKILWCGRPCQGFRVWEGEFTFHIVGLLFSIIPAVIIFFIVRMVIDRASFDVDVVICIFIFSLIFFLNGFYILLGRHFHDQLSRGHTTYAITNRRVVVRSGVLRSIARSFPLDTIRKISFSEFPDGTGNVEFGNHVFSTPYRQIDYSIPRFFRVENPSTVVDCLTKARDNYFRSKGSPRGH